MKIAYLIAAHNDPMHLKRLIKSLDVRGVADFFIHLDKRADIESFTPLGHLGNINIIPERFLIQWGGFSQCLYQKALIKACINSKNNYDRVFFLSGLDYPYWSNERIINYLNRNPEKEFICGMNVSNCIEPPKIKEKITLYHLFRDIPIKNGKIKRAISGSTRIIMKFLPFRKNPYIMIGDSKMDVFMGSSWWCVTGKCLDYIYSHMNGKIEQYFKTSFAPDEMFIQTIVFNSRFKENAISYEGSYPGLVGLTPLHLIEYHGSIKIFDESDINKIIESDKMFIRKTISGTSDKLLDIIDNMRK